MLLLLVFSGAAVRLRRPGHVVYIQHGSPTLKTVRPGSPPSGVSRRPHFRLGSFLVRIYDSCKNSRERRTCVMKLEHRTYTYTHKENKRRRSKNRASVLYTRLCLAVVGRTYNKKWLPLWSRDEHRNDGKPSAGNQDRPVRYFLSSSLLFSTCLDQAQCSYSVPFSSQKQRVSSHPPHEPDKEKKATVFVHLVYPAAWEGLRRCLLEDEIWCSNERHLAPRG